jgi:hypothetical protein
MSFPPSIFVLLAVLLVLACPKAVQAEDRTEVVERPPTTTRNVHYPSSRPPLAPTPLVKLPVGAVAPRGWLRKQLELQAAGFHGHLGEISTFLRKDNNAWLNPAGQGERGWEEVPYWLKGFGDCAYLLGNEAQIKEAKLWIEAAFQSQRDDGYFGPRNVKATVESTQGKYDLWPNMVMLHCLQSYYEFTGDRRVLNLMTRYFHWQLTVPDRDFLPPYWQQQRAADNLWSDLWLYDRTGDPKLLELADKVHRHTANWADGVPDWHNVNMAEAFGGPAFYYPRSKDPRHLQTAERNYRTIRELYGQVPGGMFGGDEICRKGYTDPRQAIETCGMVEEMFSDERLLAITGDVAWADRCEDVAFNSLPAALTADLKALRYLTSPNLVQSDRHNKAPGFYNGGAMLEMDPHSHRCCQHNFGHGWPYFAEHAWMATADNGLAAVLLGPSVVKAKAGDGVEVSIEEKTHYPFHEVVELTVTPAKPVRFPLYVRIPGWCKSPTVAVNTMPLAVAARPGQYVVVERTWNAGDRVRLTLAMSVSLRVWKKNHNSVSVDRGPLTYSLKIGEKYVRSGGTEKWPAYEILPTTPWNYGLVLDGADSAKSFQIVKKEWPASDQPFTHTGTPIELRARGKRIPEWKSDYLGLVGLLQDSPAKSSEPTENLTLIPMGAARLRITAFPVIGDGPDAHTWVVPPEALPLKVSASHCFTNDSVRAVADGLVPQNSNDHSIPRFTWWDHKGTRKAIDNPTEFGWKEWIQREFDAPRKVSRVEVYWFDDSPSGGGCRTPHSWRLLYRKNGQWHQLAKPSGYGVEVNKFNATTFAEVVTDALRIEVQLRENFSGGILEWRVP